MPKIYSAGNNLPAADLNGIVQVAGGYAASSTGNDSYVVTITPTPGSLTTGDVFRFKADVGNTGAATLNVNSLGVKTIKKYVGSTKYDLLTGDIVAGQIVQVYYDGTDFILDSYRQPITTVVTSSRAAGSGGTQNIAHNLGAIPKKVTIYAYGGTAGVMSIGVYNGSSTATSYYQTSGSSGSATDTTYIIYIQAGTGTYNIATISVDSTNVILTWTIGGGGVGVNFTVISEI